MAILVDTPEEDENYEKPRGKKNTFTENKNNLFSDIPKKYYKWLHFFKKDVITLPQY